MRVIPLIILAGGEGTRLRTVTGPDIPKPMVEVFGKPFLYWLIEHYRRQGYTNIIVSTGYRGRVIHDYPWPREWHLYFRADDDYFNGSIEYYNTNTPYEGFVVVNGDTFIPDELPDAVGPWILSCGDVDAGAQRPGDGKIKVFSTSSFYDIGTPEGLERFKIYFANNVLDDTVDATSQSDKLIGDSITSSSEKENV